MKKLHWLGSSKNDLMDLPLEVRSEFGFGLHLAQQGDRPLNATPLVSIPGASVSELRVSFDGDAYRSVYTVRYEEAVYVLHVFKKKSVNGIKTSKKDIDLVASRLRVAASHYEENYSVEKKEKRNVGRKER